MTVRGDYHRDVGGGFQAISQELYTEGALDQAGIETPTELEEAFCYIHNTLNKAIKMTTIVYLNGVECVRRVSEPAG